MTQIIGGNMLSPFYSTAIFVPYTGATTFTPFGAIAGTYWQLPFVRANLVRRRGLADVTHSGYPQTRGRRQTQITFDCRLQMFLNPDLGASPEDQITPPGNANGYQLYLTLGTLQSYPTAGTPLKYWWIPSVFVEEIPHEIDTIKDPADPIKFDLMVRSNSLAFFLPQDGTGSTCPINQFLAWLAGMTPPWSF